MMLPITVVVLMSVFSVCGVFAIGLTIRVILLIRRSRVAGGDLDSALWSQLEADTHKEKS